jgi:phage baseplate assembly protein W
MSFDLQISNGDFVLNNGDLATIINTTKLTQDLLKIATTTTGANPLQPWYGSMVGRTLVGSSQSKIIINVAQSQLQNAIANLKALQNIQVASGQSVSPSEQIASISNISITRNTIDPRIITVTINVLSRALDRVTAVFTPTNT